MPGEHEVRELDSRDLHSPGEFGEFLAAHRDAADAGAVEAVESESKAGGD